MILIHSETSMRLLKLIERRRSSPLSRNDVSDDRRRSIAHSYKKLSPSPLITLSVLKLDASIFEIQVGRNASVAELKQAVEAVFAFSNNKVPWSQVWGHFCLCYVGKKLINDGAHIRSFGIKDGDQIEFIRHMSIGNMPLEKGSKKESVPYKQQLMLTYGSNGHETKVEHNSEDFGNYVCQKDDYEDCPKRNVEGSLGPDFKLPRFWKGWFPYSKAGGAWRF